MIFKIDFNRVSHEIVWLNDDSCCIHSNTECCVGEKWNEKIWLFVSLNTCVTEQKKKKYDKCTVQKKK